MSEEKLIEKLQKFLNRYGNVRKINLGPQKSNKVYPFIVDSQTEKYAVFAFQWVKSIGTNTIIRSERLTEDMNCNGTIIIGNIFSQNALDMVEEINNRSKKKIILMSFAEIEEILNEEILNAS